MVFSNGSGSADDGAAGGSVGVALVFFYERAICIAVRVLDMDIIASAHVHTEPKLHSQPQRGAIIMKWIPNVIATAAPDNPQPTAS